MEILDVIRVERKSEGKTKEGQMLKRQEASCNVLSFGTVCLVFIVLL